MTSDPIRAAIEQLRADLDALPKELAANPDEGIDGRWEARGYSKSYVGVPVRDGGASWLHVASCEEEYEDQGQALAAHIALTASPHVTEALIRLLEAVAEVIRCETNDDVSGASGALDDVYRTTRSLAEAITHRSPT